MSVHMHTRLLNDGIDPRHVDRRLKELHALGLPYTDIAKVVRFYEGWHLSEDQVRRRLHQLGARKNPNKTRPKAGVR